MPTGQAKLVVVLSGGSVLIFHSRITWTNRSATEPGMSDESGSGETGERCCISHLFLRAASNNPNKIAVIHASGGAQLSGHLKQHEKLPFPPVYRGDRCFTYSDVSASVDSLSARISSILFPAQGNNTYNELLNHAQMTKSSAPRAEQWPEFENLYVPKIVGLFMPPSVEYIVAVLSVLRSGEAFMPLDPSWPKERILSLIGSSGADLIIGCASSSGRSCSYLLDKSHWLVEFCSCPVLCFSMEENRQECIWATTLVCPCKIREERLFSYLMYTSGSTGKPKGVRGTEKGLLNRFLWMQELYPLQGEELLLFKTSISFIDHLQEFLAAILTTCTLVIPPFNELKENLFSVVNFLQAYFITRLTSVPSLIRAILPALQSQSHRGTVHSLKLLVLSGEVLPLSLWHMLSKSLPETLILNLYGSTEVSGDCTYFDCKKLPMILERERLTSVPIGIPISNCDVLLVCENDTPNQGEIYVGGACLCSGYYSDGEKLPHNSVGSSFTKHGSQLFFKTGDFARRLQSGDLVFLGRKDRTVKVSGHRIALEEVEDVLRRHPDVVDAAVISVISSNAHGELVVLEAFIVLKEERSCEIFRSSIRSWMIDKLPVVMLPNRFTFRKTLPVSSNGKVDYGLLESSSSLTNHVEDRIDDKGKSDLLQVIKKAFCDALMVEEVSNDDDFFTLGGNSIASAHLAHNLGVNMRLIYYFPSPSKLYLALLEQKGSCDLHVKKDGNLEMNLDGGTGNMLLSMKSVAPNPLIFKPQGSLSNTSVGMDGANALVSKCLKMDSNIHFASDDISHVGGYLWNSSLDFVSCSFSRSNKVIYEGGYRGNGILQGSWSMKIPRGRNGFMQDFWKVHMESCIDASPMVVFRGQDIYLFIGSHSRKFLCICGKSGSVKWEIKLEGRIECSAAILGDFSQVVVGCYEGKIYFLDFLNGNICWTFQTSGEVKSQPVVDIRRHLIWCGSYDHNLYALDYENHCCVYMLPCGGSIYGSPAIDEMHETLYVASTSGRMTAISIKSLPFNILWLHEFEVPVFGSLTISSLNENVICCLVDGHVLALDSRGSIIWQYRTTGPIFAGACISAALPSQVLICSRDGGVYSLEQEKGDLLWEYNIGDPITASVCVDEHLQLLSDPFLNSDRLICVCSSSGSMCLLRVSSSWDINGEASQPGIYVQEFGRLNLQGDVFSSPVMIGGRIFVGCRDDYVHCITLEIESQGNQPPNFVQKG